MFPKGTKLASFEHRMDMCRAAFTKLATSTCRVAVKATEQLVCLRRFEEDASSKTGTADILDTLVAENPDVDFSFALGGDTYHDLVSRKWRRSEDIAKMIHNRFYVFDRASSSNSVFELLAAQNATAAELGAAPAAAFGGVLMHLPNIPGADKVSSTWVREQLADDSGDEEKLDPASPLTNPAMIDPEVLAICRRPKGGAAPLYFVQPEDPAAPTPSRRPPAAWYETWALAVVPLLVGVALVATAAWFGYVPFMGGGAAAPALTVANFENRTAGKALFLKMYAPWCGHCKQLKPTWDALARAVNREDGYLLVADVDCTSDGGKPLCNEHAVKGFPTLLWGDTTGGLRSYEGGRAFRDLKAHALGLKKPCHLDALDACSAADQLAVAGYLALAPEELRAAIGQVEANLKAVEDGFTAAVEALKQRHKQLSDEHEAARLAIRESGLGAMRAVHAQRRAAKAG
jgi:nicotinic acid mononucleotide adenylyltransferase/thiol-disulfide isomerase/thioredoxin